MSEQTQDLERPKHRNQHPPAVTKAKQQRYLQVMSETGSHAQACKSAQISENAPCLWAQRSRVFAKEWELARERGEKVLLLKYESNLDQVLLPDNQLNIEDFAKLQNSRFFRMKRLDPRYRDNATVEVNVKGPAAVQINLGAPTQSTKADAQAEAET